MALAGLHKPFNAFTSQEYAIFFVCAFMDLSLKEKTLVVFSLFIAHITPH